MSESTYRAITSSPCELYRLPSCDTGRRICESDDLALRNSCDNERCACEKSPAKHCDCCVVELMREGEVLKYYFLERRLKRVTDKIII